MGKLDTYWHRYRRHQIRPELRGRFTMVFAVPRAPGSPIVRHVIESAGSTFPGAFQDPESLLSTAGHGIVFEGINKAAAFDVLLLDPPLSNTDPEFVFYNREIVRNARQFLLLEPNRDCPGTPEATARLLRGQAPVPEEAPVAK